jgi:hypothetical protein
LSTTGPGSVSYCWGYYLDGQLQETDERSDTHVINADDLRFSLACIVRTFRPEGDRGKDLIFDVVPSIKERLTPVIRSATVQQVDQALCPETALAVGQEYRVVIDCIGPPILRQDILWQRSTDSANWTTAGRGQFYRTVTTDRNKYIRAICTVIATTPVINELTSNELAVEALRVTGDNSVLRRLASTMKRFCRAQFDAVFVTGAAVAVVLEIQGEKPQLLIQKAFTVLFKSSMHDVEIESINDSENAVSLRGRHGYHTELAIGSKKMNGGMEFEPAQARELFMETFEAFRTKPGKR